MIQLLKAFISEFSEWLDEPVYIVIGNTPLITNNYTMLSLYMVVLWLLTYFFNILTV